jgi:hypothetical protein
VVNVVTSASSCSLAVPAPAAGAGATALDARLGPAASAGEVVDLFGNVIGHLPPHRNASPSSICSTVALHARCARHWPPNTR